MSEIKVISLDFWRTIARPNHEFSSQRLSIMSNLFGIEKKLLKKCLIESERYIEEVSLHNGKHYGFEERINDLHCRLDLPFQEGNLKKVYQCIESEFLKFPPILNEPDLRKTLDCFVERGMQIAIVSNTGYIKGKTLDIWLEDNKLLEFLKIRIYSDQVGVCKPNPSIFELLSKKLSQRKKEIKNFDGTTYRPENYSTQFYGPQTLRRGIERSRNVMTVRLAQDIGMPLVSEYSRLFGIHDKLPPYLAMSLGAGETTVLKMTAAYATIANGGRKINPTLIDRVQDRYGKTVFRHDERICDGCDADQWANQAEPLVVDTREQILDPMTAYQITSMMEGVIKRGTGARVRAVGRPVAGKTGTSNDYKDAWFVGFTPELAVGVYVGYDTPKRMGRAATGGELAAPIFTAFVQKALAGKPPTPFKVPAGMTPYWIDPKTGVKVSGGEGAISEAFKPGTGPNLITSVIGVDSDIFENLENGADQDFNAGRGGLF